MGQVSTGYPIYMSNISSALGGANDLAWYRGRQYWNSGGGSITISQNPSMAEFLGIQTLTYFPDSFGMQAFLYDSYGYRYLWATVSVAHLSAAYFSGVSANIATIDYMPGSAGIGVTNNSQSRPCEYFDFYTETRRGCQNGNDQEHYTTVRVRALSGSYETTVIGHSQSQWGC